MQLDIFSLITINVSDDDCDTFKLSYDLVPCFSFENVNVQ